MSKVTQDLYKLSGAVEKFRAGLVVIFDVSEAEPLLHLHVCFPL